MLNLPLCSPTNESVRSTSTPSGLVNTNKESTSRCTASLDYGNNRNVLIWKRSQKVILDENTYLTFHPNNDLIAIGCTSRVYKALLHCGDSSQQIIEVAIKVAEEKEDLVLELQMLKQIESHENVINLQLDPKDEQCGFLIFPLALGTLDSEIPCIHDLAVMLDIASQLLLGIQHLHSQNIVHRDIKPHNLLLFTSHKGGQLLLKIADFGGAASIKSITQGSELGQEGMGTTPYTAPEILQATKKGTVVSWADWKAADLYSAGVTLYYLFTKRQPFQTLQAGSPVRLLIAISQCFFGTHQYNPLPSNWMENSHSSSSSLSEEPWNKLPPLLYALTHPNPEQRPTALQALQIIFSIKR